SGGPLGSTRRPDRPPEEPPPESLARLRGLGHRPPRGMDRLLRQARAKDDATRIGRLPAHQVRHHPEAPRCVNLTAACGERAARYVSELGWVRGLPVTCAFHEKDPHPSFIAESPRCPLPA